MESADFIEDHVSKYFNIKSVHVEKKALYFIVWDYDRDKFVKLVDDLDKIGYLPFIDDYEGSYKINIINKPKQKKSKIHINIILFIVTIISTIFAWSYYNKGSLIEGIEFSIALLAIIGAHETAHYFAARKHGVKATLPYFIPAPTLIGTFGAVINVKSAIPNKNALFDLGVSGPIAGIIVTLPVLIIGLYLSITAPMQSGTPLFIPSPLMYIAIQFISSPAPEGYGIMINPFLFAAWVGIIVTMLNLMPVAFLDGGHISRSLFSEKMHKYLSIAGMIVTFLLGWIPMAILMGVILFMSKRHPGALDNVSKLSKNRKIFSVVMIIILILCLSPIPITQI